MGRNGSRLDETRIRCDDGHSEEGCQAIGQKEGKMTSSVKMAMDTRGYWKPGDSREFETVTKFFVDYDETQLKKDILDLKPIQEWFCGVVCVSKVKKLEPGNDPIDWDPPKYLFNTRAYELPMDINRIVSDIFDLSLSHRILGVNPRLATIYVMESEDGITNITAEIVGLLFEVFKRPIKTLSEELNVRRWKND